MKNPWPLSQLIVFRILSATTGTIYMTWVRVMKAQARALDPA